MKLIRTILADDHKLFCDGLENLLSESHYFQVVKKFHHGLTLLENIGNLSADLLILDIEIPGVNGLDILQRIRLHDSKLKIVILSMHEQSVYSREALREGANGYLTKAMDSPLLIQHLLKIAKGAQLFQIPPTVARTEAQILSKREVTILKSIATGKTSDEISSDLCISSLTVKTHRRNIMRKLQTTNSAGLISKAFAMGII